MMKTHGGAEIESRPMENANTENASTKHDILQGWKMQVLKIGKYEFARVEYASTKNINMPVNANVEITMELPLIVE